MTEHITLDDGQDLHISRVSRPELVLPLAGEADAAVKLVRTGRAICYVIAALTIGMGVFQLSQGLDPWQGGGIVVEGLIFASLAFFVPRNPALLLGLAAGLYFLDIVILAFDGASALTSGLAMRAVILYFFYRSINAARALTSLRGRLRELGVTPAQLSRLDEL